MKTVALVPMKLNNQRLPNKNTKCFTNGKPLCHYLLSTLVEVEGIDEIYVYCSNPGIQDYIPDGIHYLRRSEKLDQNSTKMNAVLKSFASDVPADIYLLAHVTAPFISKNAIERGLQAVKSGVYDSAFSAKRLQDFLWKDGSPLNYDPGDIPRTQDLEPIYEETSGFYIYKSEVLKKGNRRIGVTPYIVEVNELEGIDIDDEEDFVIADAVFNHVIKFAGGGGNRLLIRVNSAHPCADYVAAGKKVAA